MDNLSTAKSSNLAGSHPDYRADIDGLRAVAIISVVVFHAFPQVIPGGFVGVDIFFVISGYLISRIILNETLEGTFSFLRFYGRRIRRIFPALILVLAAVVMAGSLVLLKSEFDQLTAHVIASTFFSQNLALLSEAGYFDRQSDVKPLLHLWSLSVEEQFYIAFPILIVFMTKMGRRGWIPFALTAIWLLSYAFGNHTLRQHPEEAFYLPHLRAWELLAGALLTMAEANLKRALALHDALAAVLAAIGAALILRSFYWLDSESTFPGSAALWPVIGAVCLIAAGPQNFLSRTVLSSRPFVAIGLISYPLYLWHWPALTFLRIMDGALPSIASRAIVLTISVALAVLTYRSVELPLRRKAFRKYPVISSVGLAIALCTTAGIALVGNLGLLDQFRPTGLLSNTANFTWDGRFENQLCRKKYPDFKGRFCSLAEDRAPTVALIGDSHAMVYFDGLKPIISAHGGNLLNLGSFSCMPVFDATLYSHGYPLRDNECPASVNAALAEAEQNPNITTVVLAGRRFQQLLTPEERAAVETTFKATFERLTRARKRVIYILDFPEINFDPPSCVRSLDWGRKNCLVSVATARDLRGTQQQLIERVVKGSPSVRIVDPFDVLCQGSVCPIVRGDRAIYLDASHLSRDGSSLAAPIVASAIFN